MNSMPLKLIAPERVQLLSLRLDPNIPDHGEQSLVQASYKGA